MATSPGQGSVGSDLPTRISRMTRICRPGRSESLSDGRRYPMSGSAALSRRSGSAGLPSRRCSSGRPGPMAVATRQCRWPKPGAGPAPPLAVRGTAGWYAASPDGSAAFNSWGANGGRPARGRGAAEEKSGGRGARGSKYTTRFLTFGGRPGPLSDRIVRGVSSSFPGAGKSPFVRRLSKRPEPPGLSTHGCHLPRRWRLAWLGRSREPRDEDVAPHGNAPPVRGPAVPAHQVLEGLCDGDGRAFRDGDRARERERGQGPDDHGLGPAHLHQHARALQAPAVFPDGRVPDHPQ